MLWLDDWSSVSLLSGAMFSSLQAASLLFQLGALTDLLRFYSGEKDGTTGQVAECNHSVEQSHLYRYTQLWLPCPI